MVKRKKNQKKKMIKPRTYSKENEKKNSSIHKENITEIPKNKSIEKKRKKIQKKRRQKKMKKQIKSIGLLFFLKRMRQQFHKK